MSHCDFVAGVFAGACNLLLSHPLDTIKTNMQSSNMKFMEATMCVVRAEGIKGYYRGLLFPLCSTGLFNSIVFGVYGNSFRYLQDKTVKTEDQQKYWFHHVFLAGCLGGVMRGAVACPIEIAKVRLQLRVNNATGPVMVLTDLVKREGTKSLFKGLTPMLWSNIVPYGIFMLVYEYLVEKLRDYQQSPHAGKNPLKHYKETNVNSLNTAIAGACAGMISWIPAIPFDVAKTHMMAEQNPNRFRNIWACFASVTRESGYRSLYRGGTVLVLRSAPISAITFVAYEYMLRHCQSRSIDVQRLNL